MKTEFRKQFEKLLSSEPAATVVRSYLEELVRTDQARLEVAVDPTAVYRVQGRLTILREILTK